VGKSLDESGRTKSSTLLMESGLLGTRGDDKKWGKNKGSKSGGVEQMLKDLTMVSKKVESKVHWVLRG